MSGDRSVIACIVAVLGLAVCAGTAFGAGPGASPEEVGQLTVGDMVDWVKQNTPLVMGVLGLCSMLILWRIRCLRAGGLDEGGRDVMPLPSLMWLFAAASTFLMMGIGGELGREIALGIPPEGPKREAVMTVIAAGLGSLFGLGMLWFVHRQAPKSGARGEWADIPLGIGLFVVVYPLVALAGILGQLIARGVDTVSQDPIAHNTLRLIAQNQGDPWNWVLIGSVILLIPLIEELIYRVYLQSTFLRIFRSRWAAVLVTSVLFVAVHWPALPEGGKHALAPLFALSVAMGASYERTGRLGVPIVMHMSFNALNVFLAFVIDPMQAS